MKLLIIEDEARIAARIARMVGELMPKPISIERCDSLEHGIDFLSQNQVDLLLLDLNLNGADGFEILKTVVSQSFHTIIISADKRKAVAAFEFGVLDFIAKPFDQARMAKALGRFTAKQQVAGVLKFLAVRNKGKVLLIDIADIIYFKGADIYTEIHLHGNIHYLHDKSLEKLSQLLPNTFVRTHKSYLVAESQFEKIAIQAGGKYMLTLKNGIRLPIGRSRYENLKNKWV